MNVAQRKLGMYTVHAAALELGTGGGYHAGVIVTLSQGTGLGRQEVFRDEQLDDARVWDCPRQALVFALEMGEAVANTHEVFGDFEHWSGLGANPVLATQAHYG